RDDLILCVNEDSGLIVNDNSAEPFFDNQGQLAGPVQKIMDFLSQIEQNRAMTRQAVSGLADAKVIEEWPLKIQYNDQKTPVTGLYRVDEAKLNALSDDQFLKLRKAGSLAIAYGQLLSMGNVRVFEKLSAVHQAEKNRSANPNDDILSFQ
ncbi:MAG: SapC family protein, partial [Desulfotignum sp.]